MIRAIFDCNRETGKLEMRVHGHANFAKLGKDPVCAGASVLALSAAQCIDLMEKAGNLQNEAVFRIDNGNVRVKCLPKPEYFDEALIVFHVAHVGMELLAAAYPENAEVKVIGAAKADSIKESSTSRTD